MNKILNYLRIIIAILVTVLLFFVTFICPDGFLALIPLILYFFFGATTILDFIRKNYFSNKHNIVFIIIMLLIVLIIVKPWFDILLGISIGSFDIIENIGVLFRQNSLPITILVGCLFILNYVDYKLK